MTIPLLRGLFELVDRFLTEWMSRYGVPLLRFGLGLVFIWFGALKFVPGLSPAEDLALDTIAVLTFGLMPPTLAQPILALWEVLIGLGFLTGRFLRLTLLLLFVQMIGTVMPLFIFPELTFTHVPYAPTLEGQYIIKNVVLVAAALVIGATVRGGELVADPNRIMTASRLNQEHGG